MWPKKLEKIPAVKAVMTPFPYHVELTQTLAEARTLMTTKRIHHLPVMENGRLVGMISYRDLLRTHEQIQSDEARTVADIPLDKAYVVDLSEPLDQVLMHMAEKRLGAAVAVKEGRLAGIFTLTDACRCLAEALRQQFPPGGGTDAA